MGAEVSRGDHGGPRSTRHTERAEAGRRLDGCRLPRPVLHELRRSGRAARPSHGQQSAEGDQASARRSAGERAGKTG